MHTLNASASILHPTMEALWTQVRRRGDLPGFSRVVGAILSAMRGENDREFNMTKTVLSDPALTQRVLRLANSPMYAVFGGNINTVSKAVIVLGSEVIGHLALGLKLIDGLSSALPGTAHARGEMQKALLAGHVARELASSTTARDTEEVVVCSMLHSLGRIMVSFYLPEKWEAIKNRCEQGVGEAEAAQEVLEVSLVDIGRATAERWGLPASLIDTLQDIPPRLPDEPLSHAQWLAAVSTVSTRCAAVMHREGPDASREIAKLAHGYADMLGLDPAQLITAVDSARLTAEEEDIVSKPPVRIVRAADAPTAAKPADAQSMLAAGVADLRGMGNSASPAQRVTVALETVYKGLGLSRAIMFLRNVEEARYAARLHFGVVDPELMVRLVLGDAYEPDVFHAALSNNKMVFVENPHAPGFAAKLPAWWSENLRSTRSFIMMPLMVHHHAVGFIYGDWSRLSEKVSISAAEIGLLDELRLRAVHGITDWRRLERELGGV